MLLLLLVNFVSGFSLELTYIPHCKYQVKPHSSPCVSAACAAAIIFSTVNLLYLLYSVAWRCCLLHLIKQNYLLKTFLRTFLINLVSLPVFPSRTNLKLHNISVTPKMAQKVVTNLDSSKTSGPDCIPVVVLKKCEPEISYTPAELFNMCLKMSCFPDCWKVLSVIRVFEIVRERSIAKNYSPVSLLSVVSKVFGKLLNNRIVDHLEKCGLFSDVRS